VACRTHQANHEQQQQHQHHHHHRRRQPHTDSGPILSNGNTNIAHNIRNIGSSYAKRLNIGSLLINVNHHEKYQQGLNDLSAVTVGLERWPSLSIKAHQTRSTSSPTLEQTSADASSTRGRVQWESGSHGSRSSSDDETRTSSTTKSAILIEHYSSSKHHRRFNDLWVRLETATTK